MAKIQRDTNINKKGTLGAKLFKLVGNPTYMDEPKLEGKKIDLDALYWRLKWPMKFSDTQHVKMREVLVGYEDMVVEYERSFQQVGKSTEVVSVLKLKSRPDFIKLKDWDKEIVA